MRTLKDIEKSKELAIRYTKDIDDSGKEVYSTGAYIALEEMAEHKNKEFEERVKRLRVFEERKSRSNSMRFNGDRIVTRLRAELQQAEKYYWAGYEQALIDIKDGKETDFDIKNIY